MRQLLRFGALGALLLLLGVGLLHAQEVVFTAGPAVTPTSGASNGGFAWGDVNGDGTLDVWIPSSYIVLNNLTSFAAAASTKTANVTGNVNSVGGLLADFNGDGVLDLWSTQGANPSQGLYYDSSGVFIRATGTGDLSTAPGTGTVFAGMAVADINHSNYLSAAWSAIKGTYSDGLVFPKGNGIVLLKGGASGFTNAGNNATPANLSIDTTRSFESWNINFLDANNDKYPDLMMTSMRHGFQPTATAVDSQGARKGCVLYMNDGTGKFIVPTGATLGRTIFNVDSISQGKSWGRAVADTGIIVEDTVRHFSAIGFTWGDLNNDGNADLIFTGLGADNYNGQGTLTRVIVVYGKGDGTFTYKWNGTSYVHSGLPDVNNIRAWDIGDYNNDGFPDIFGAVTFGPRRMWRGNGNGTYTEVTTETYMSTNGGRAGSFVDYNNDGFLDVYTYTGLNSSLQRNSGNSNHWIAFTPVGTGNNKSAIGARFTLYAQGGTLKQTRFIKGEGNAGGGSALRANFGIGINTSIDSVVVWWPDGTTKSYTGLAVDKYWTVVQGSENPSAPTLATPANAATAVAQTGTLTWSAAAGAASYKVQVSLDATFENAALLAVDAPATGTSYAYSLGAATKYYWRVAAVNGGFMSAFSAANNFTTAGAAAAVVPTLLSPADAAVNQPASLTLKVGKTSAASRYQWQVSVLSTFTTLFASETTADTAYTVQLVGGQKFYWRVRGVNDLGATAYSAAQSFTIMAAPARTTLVSPANNTQNVISDSVFFAWRAVSGAASYNLQVSTVNATNTYSTTDTTYRLNNLAKLTNYTWKVEAINAGGTSNYTGNFAFTTIIAAPAVPSALLPASAAGGVGRLGPFVWNSTLNATKYRLQIASDNAFATIVRDTTVALDTTCVLRTPLGLNADYYWRVRAENLGGASAYSTARLFTTGTVLDVEDLGGAVPQEFALLQNYPNPFNPSTLIRYDLAASAHVNIAIFDVLGRVVTTLVDEVQSASRYSVNWNATGLSSGIYFYRIYARSQDGARDFISTKKLILMK
ncbi:MAG: hypothetical protein A2X66_02935 [Ignavibacteria bacterium GWA2_54_16]|nr:MAG: hypothetical protein A2X66_02935 [Ignavibacteria bacterium GWA2_54_16]